MTAQALVADVLAAEVPGVVAETEFGDPVAVVPADRWRAAAAVCRDALGLTYLDMVTGVDEGDRLGVVAYLWSPSARAGLLLRTSVPADDPTLDSITPLYAGADWHERETAEMFGVVFAGHPNPVPLLLPDPPPAGLAHPLRKSVVLERRDPAAWPGRVEP